MKLELYYEAQELVMRKAALEELRTKLLKTSNICFSPIGSGSSLTISECGNYPELTAELKNRFLTQLDQDIKEVEAKLEKL